MIGNQIENQILFHDGTSQGERSDLRLDSNYANIDDRSISDWIEFAKGYAAELQFDGPGAATDWSPFFDYDAEEILAFIEDPEFFKKDEEKFFKLAQPHYALFVAFLQLMQHIKDQMNTLTGKHLDFFYTQALQLTAKTAEPDRINVLIQLAEGTEIFPLPAGTRIVGGEDSEGNDLIYTTDELVVINQASVVELKTLFLDREFLDIAGVKEKFSDELDGGFMEMMRAALGEDGPGDQLPEYEGTPVELVSDLEAILTLVEVSGPDLLALAYVEEQLFLSLENFLYIFEVYYLFDVATDEDWQSVYDILAQAYVEKIEAGRRAELRAIREGEIDPAIGFQLMVEFALGDPEPGDSLPRYNGLSADLDVIYSELLGSDVTAAANAAEYVSNTLFMVDEDFIEMIETKNDTGTDDEDWEEVYEFLERASRAKRNIPLPVAEIEDFRNHYAWEDAKLSTVSSPGDELLEESNRWNTFGSPRTEPESTPWSAEIGMAISSPLLELSEGKRTIVCSFEVDTEQSLEFDLETLTEAMTPVPFLYQFSGEEDWIIPTTASVETASIAIVKASESIYTATIVPPDTGEELYLITKTVGDDFTSEDIGKFIIWDDAKVYRIDILSGVANVQGTLIGEVAAHTDIRKYAPEDIFQNALIFTFTIDEKGPAVVPPGAALTGNTLNAILPLLKIALKNLPPEVASGNQLSKYQLLKDIVLSRVNLSVEVQEMEKISVQNDSGSVDPQKAFEPFETQPLPNSSLFFSHPEISSKKLDAMKLHFHWKGTPQDFKDHYESYWKILLDKEILDPGDYTIDGNQAFTLKLRMFDRNSRLTIQDNLPIFDATDATLPYTLEVKDIPRLIDLEVPGYPYPSILSDTSSSNVLNWDRYFRLDLNAPDFQHSKFITLFSQQAVSDFDAIKKLTINPPYDPNLIYMRLSYTASEQFDFADYATQDYTQSLMHIHPFGHSDMGPETSSADTPYYLLPRYLNDGELFIGLQNLAPPSAVSVLIQMVEGSSNPDLLPSPVSWHYLRNNQWASLDDGNILSDETEGLFETGIIQFDIPKDANSDNTRMPSGYHWLRATVFRNPEGLPDSVDVHTQALSATLVSEGVPESHFATPLAPNSIEGPESPIAEIAEISQPYASEEGKSAEATAAFNIRISERLRHKDRALTLWDYERIVLEEFPGIYSAKTIPSYRFDPEAIPGQVNVVVIPDIKGRQLFNPFEPKAPTRVLREIQTFLDGQASAFARITVQNPVYIQVQVKVLVALREGLNPLFYRKQLDEDLKKFLAPWAFDEGADVLFGGKLYANTVLNFIDNRPYVDYARNIELLQSIDGEEFIEAETLTGGENIVYTTQPDQIIVSGTGHLINLVSDGGYVDDLEFGIDFMIVETDFRVG